ncbi:MAG: hypothetical protein GY832_28295 [Chloroflexi bacterium]|nr:hypothetical protein [Chloroflexota bacterium]
MLETNEGCEFPCWWGITPGETSWQDMLTFFRTQGVPMVTRKSDDSTESANLTEESAGIWVSFGGQGNLVQNVFVTGSFVNESTDQGIVQSSPSGYMARFNLDSVLSTYGVPSQVYLHGGGSGSHGPPGYYYLWLEYAELGILVGYYGYAFGGDTQYAICPEGGGVNEIELWLHPPGNPFADTMELRRVAFMGWSWKTLEEAVEGMSLENFHSAFAGAEFPGCLRILEDKHLVKIVRPNTLPPLLTSEEDAQLVEMLQTNGGCELPCWWGITPGTTSVEDAQNVFLSFEKPIIVYERSLGIEYEVGTFERYESALVDYFVEHSLGTEDDVVSYISVSATPPGWSSYSQYMAQDWQRYTLAAIMTRLGPPSRIRLFYEHPNCGQTYRLGIMYDDLGVLASYSGVLQREEDSVSVCPRIDDLIGMSMFLATPSQVADAGLDTRGWNPDIDANDFYQTYLDHNTTACLELPEQIEYTCE